jgi:hypothetical protein
VKARALALTAMALATSGCALNPFVFSERLDTFTPRGTDGTLLRAPRPAHRGEPLVGDLDLALVALMDQRRLLWAAAGDTETMKNATALGLIALGAVAAYKGLESELNRRWLARAGLSGAAVYGGAQWLEPSKRQQVYLEGAKSLTCLALATAPYEMKAKDFDDARSETRKAHAALERLFSTLRIVGDFRGNDHERFIVRGAWKKARFADAVLRQAEAALGNLEAMGPRLRDLTAQLAGTTADKAAAVSRDLSDLKSALAALKVDANLVIGAQLFEVPKRTDEPGVPAPAGAPAVNEGDDQPEACPTRSAPPPAGSASGAAASPPAAKTGAAAAAPKAPGAGSAVPPAAASRPPLTPPQQPLAPDEVEWKRARLAEIHAALNELNAPLGAVLSLLRRLEAARLESNLPPGCEQTSAFRVLPSERVMRLMPGERAEFAVSGSPAAPVARLLGTVPAAGELEVVTLDGRGSPAERLVRLSAAPTVARELNTVLVVSDSARQREVSIKVRVCAGKPGD